MKELPEHQTMLLKDIFKREHIAARNRGKRYKPFVDISDWEWELLNGPVWLFGRKVNVIKHDPRAHK